MCRLSVFNNSKDMLLHLFLLLSHITGLIAADTISPVQHEVSGREGQSVTLTCTYTTSYNDVYLYWYRHHSDLQAPQFILWKREGSGSDSEHIPDRRYGSQTSQTSTALTIRKLTLADTALYYCAVVSWSWLMFGTPISLRVDPADPTPVTPTLFILSPLQPAGYPPKTAEQLGPDVCLAAGFRPRDGEMVLNVGGGPVNVSTGGGALSQSGAARGTYFFVGFSNQTVHSCELHGSTSNNEADDPCTDFHPEKAKLNFYLVLMNSVRVLFTKSVAFSAALTVRALQL